MAKDKNGVAFEEGQIVQFGEHVGIVVGLHEDGAHIQIGEKRHTPAAKDCVIVDTNSADDIPLVAIGDEIDEMPEDTAFHQAADDVVVDLPDEDLL